MKKNLFKILCLLSIITSFVFLIGPVKIEAATANNYKYVSETGTSSLAYKQGYSTFSSIVGNYSISNINNSVSTITATINSRTLYRYDDPYNNNSHQESTYVESVCPVYNSSYDWSDLYGSYQTYYDKTSMGAGNGWLYAIEFNNERKYAYQTTSTLSFSKLTTTGYIYIPIRQDEYWYDGEPDGSNYTFGVVKYSFNITLDDNAPTINGIENNGYYRTTQNIELQDTSGVDYGKSYMQWNDGSKSYFSVNNTSQTADAEGIYKVHTVDIYGNKADYKFTIDKTAPTINGIENNKWYNKNVSVSFSDTYLDTVTIDDIDKGPITSFQFTSEGEHSCIVRDKAGNSTTYKFTIDKSTPIGDLVDASNNILENNCITTAEYVRFIWTASNIESVKLNGATYKSGEKIYEERSHTLVITNYAGTSSTYTFTIDKTAPTGALSTTQAGGFRNGNLTNGNVTFTWTEVGCTASLNGEEYISGTTIVDEGKYTIILTDAAGRTSSYTFEIDKTAPIVDFQNNICLSQNSILIKINDATNLSNCYYVRSGNEEKITILSKTTNLNGEGYYTIYLEDEVGNSNTYHITLDSTKPTAEFSSYPYSNANQIIRLTDNVGINYTNSYLQKDKNKMSITSSTFELEENGNYLLYLCDTTGNYTQYEFVIDKNFPKLVASVSSNSIIKSNVTITSITPSISGIASQTYTLNGKNKGPFNLNTVFEEEGNYILLITSNAGNSTTYNFTIDKTAPTGTLSTTQAGGFRNGNLTNGNVTFTWTEANCTARYENGATYSKGNVITSEGTNTLYLYDLAGNKSQVYTFTIDKTAPTGALSTTQAGGFRNGNLTNGNVTFTWTEANCTARYENGATYSKGNVITSEGTNTLYLYDLAGNKSQAYTFTIDKTAPTGRIEINKGFIVEVSSLNYLTKEQIIFNANENNCTVTYSHNNEFPTQYNSEIKTKEGIHTFVISDKAGNSTSYVVEIDKTAPIGILNNLTNSTLKLSNSYVYFTWKETGCSALLDNNVVLSQGSMIEEEGIHTIVLTDAAGNSTTYTFEIDKTAPTGTLVGVENNGITGSNVSFAWAESNCTATLNENAYFKNTQISAENNYQLILTDAAGNSTTYKFTIDKTAPNYTIYCENNTVEDIQSNFNSFVYFTWTEEGCTASLNGDNYFKNQSITEEGTYIFTLSDQYGNINSFKFSIDYTPFTKNYEYFLTTSGYYSTVNHWWRTNTYVFNSSTYQYDVSNYYAFTSYENAYSFALYRETDTCEYGTYSKGQQIWSNTYNCYVSIYDSENAFDGSSYTIYKSKISATTYVAYFSGLFLADAMEQYASQSIKEQCIPTQIAPAFPGDENNKAQNILLTQTDLPLIYSKNDVIFNHKEEGATLKINGVNSPYTTRLSLEGTYIITEIDIAGNECKYILIIDKTAPEFIVSNIDDSYSLQNSLNQNTSIRVSNSLSLALNDNFDKQSILKITLPTGEEIYKYNGESYSLTASGEYTISAIDTARNVTSTKTIYLSFEKPTTTIIDTLDAEKRPIGFTFSINLINKLNHVSSITIQKWNEEGKIWDRLYSDAKGVLIDNKSTSYYFIASGKYQFIVIDDFGREINDSYELNRDKPVGYLHSSTGEILNSGFVQMNDDGTINAINPTITNSSIYINWTDQPGNRLTAVIIYKDGITNLQYPNGNPIRDAGTYVIRLKDNDSNYCDFAFIIDKTAPTGALYTEGNIEILDSKTNQNAYFSWTEPDCTATYTTKNSSNVITYYKNSILTKDETYYFTLSDKAGNISNYTLRLDKTPPIVRIFTGSYELANNSFTNGKIRFVWNESGCTATLNGEEYISGTIKSDNLKYVLKITDSFGNEAIYNVTVNNTPITVSYYNMANEKINESSLYNEAIYLVPSKEECTMTLNGFTYRGEPISLDNTYTVKIIDKYGNTYSYKFTIDTIAPTGTLSTTQTGGFRNGNLTNGTVSFTWNETGCTVTLDGNSYSKNELIKTNGTHVINLADKAGNISTYEFTIDTIAPTGTLVGVENNGSTQNNVLFTWDESNCIALLNDYNYTGYEISEEKVHHIILEDAAGNSTTYTFEIDRTAPEGTLIGVNNNGYTATSVKFTWTEPKLLAKLNGVPYEKNDYISANGSYEIQLFDQAGNYSIYTFEIDKTKPIGALVGVENNGITNSYVSFTFEGTASATLNNELYISGNLIESEGTYQIILTSLSGLTETYNFTIDKTAPTGTLSTTQTGGFRNGNLTNGNVSFTWSETGCTATLDGVTFSKNGYVRTEGVHEIILTDKAGNSTTYTFEIDKTAIDFSLQNVEIFGSTKETVILNILDTFENAKLVKLSTGYEIDIFDYFYEIIEENTYSFYFYDLAGNETYINFTIDKTAPEGILTGVENNGITNSNVTFTWTEKNCKATLNGNLYNSGVIIKAEGVHEIKLCDNVGNYTIYVFEIDKTAPEGTLITSQAGDFRSGNLTNGNVIFTSEEKNVEATLNGATYILGNIIDEENVYTLILTDKAGNSTTYTFEIDKTAPEGTLVGVDNLGTTATSVSFYWTESGCTATLNSSNYTKNASISKADNYTINLTDKAGNISTYEFIIDKSTPLGTLVGVEDGGYTNSNVYFTWDNTENYSVTLNNDTYMNGSMIEEEGKYLITVISINGLSISYSFEIDKTAPTGTLVGVENNGVTGGISATVSFNWNDANANAVLNNINYISETEIKDEGSYILVLTDLAGNSTTYIFEIDKTAPAVRYTGEIVNGLSKESIKFIWSEENCTATLNDEEYINKQIIDEEGKYIFTLIDYVGNAITYTFEIDKTAPIGILTGINENNYSTTEVSFTWTESGCTATLNGNKYRNATSITTPGTYTIILTDLAGNFSSYSFIIDKSVPTIEFLDEFNNIISTEKSFITAKDVYLTYDETLCIIQMNGHELETFVFTEDGTYELKVISKFTGTTNIYEFTIDKTAPTGTLVGVENNGVTFNNVTFTWDIIGCTVTLDGEKYNKRDTIKTEGLHTIIITNKLGVSSTYIFTINKMYPEATVYNENNDLISLELDAYINFNLYFNFKTDYIATYTLNSEVLNYSSGNILSEEGEYTLIITNPINLLTLTYVFTIDKTAPTALLDGVEDGGITNKSVTISWDKNDAKIKVNDETKSNTGSFIVSSNGNWTILIYDAAGNSTTYTFERNKRTISTDELTVYQLKLNEKEELEQEVISFKTNYTTQISFEIPKEYTAMLSYEMEGVEQILEYNSNTLLKDNNSYKITLKDKYGNENTYNFRISIPGSTTPSFFGKNLAILIIVLVPCVLIGLGFIIKLKSKHSNPFQKKRKA